MQQLVRAIDPVLPTVAAARSAPAALERIRPEISCRNVVAQAMLKTLEHTFKSK